MFREAMSSAGTPSTMGRAVGLTGGIHIAQANSKFWVLLKGNPRAARVGVERGGAADGVYGRADRRGVYCTRTLNSAFEGGAGFRGLRRGDKAKILCRVATTTVLVGELQGRPPREVLLYPQAQLQAQARAQLQLQL